MQGPICAVIFYIVLKVTVCFAKHDHDRFNKMEETIQIPCDTNEQCEEMESNGYKCIDFICTCENTKKCQKFKPKTMVSKIGRNCSELARCNIEYSFCNSSGKCDCLQQTISSKDRRRCLNETLQIGLPCEEDVQCVPLNGMCKEGTCRCFPHMHTKKGICYNTTALGEFCKTQEECVDYSSCKDSTCTCDKKYVQHDSKCLLKATGFSSPCSENIQCSSTMGTGSVCANGYCLCLELYHYNQDSKRCVTDALLGEVCNNHTDCHQPGSEESRLECILGECKCQSSYYEKDSFCLDKSSGNTSRPFGVLDILSFIFTYTMFYVML